MAEDVIVQTAEAGQKDRICRRQSYKDKNDSAGQGAWRLQARLAQQGEVHQNIEERNGENAVGKTRD